MDVEFKRYKGSFVYLLISLVVYVFFVSIADGEGTGDIILSTFFTVFVFLCILTNVHKHSMIVLSILSGAITIVTHWIIIVWQPNVLTLYIFYAAVFLFLTINAYGILKSVVSSKEITTDTLCGAVTVYLLIGIIWSLLYSVMDIYNPFAFSKYVAPIYIHHSAQLFYYYSFTTLTTLGLGDILPLSNMARTCSWLEAVTGQIYIATLISQLVGMKIIQKTR